MKTKLFKHLYLQVIFAIFIGIVLGHYWPHLGIQMKPLGDGFVKLIRMVVAFVIFCTVVSGIAGMENIKTVGRTGAIALIYFEIVSTIALIIGLIIVNIVKPGEGMNIDPITLNTEDLPFHIKNHEGHTFINYIMDIIPRSIVSAFSGESVLQVLFLAILFGFALQRLNNNSSNLLLEIIKSISDAIFSIINIIMRLAPIGAFGAMAFTVGKYGLPSLLRLSSLIICFYLTCILFVTMILGLIARIVGFNIFNFIRYIKEELIIVLGTSSSESVLPRMLDKLEKLGCKKSVVRMVIPAGYAFNLDGTSIYLTMGYIFIAQATNTHIDIFHQFILLLLLLIASKGAAGVTGSGFVVLSATIYTIGHLPPAGLTLILGVDRFMSEARALTNLIGNAVATIAVSKYVNQLDEPLMKKTLSSVRHINR